MKTCDYCGRENTDEAAHCRECGTRFASEDDPKPPKSPERIAAEKKIFTGAILFGGLRILRGLADRDKQQSTESIGSHALSYATRLEAEGRIQEALVVYQQIIQQYPDSDPARDAKKSIKNIHANRPIH